MRRVFAVMACAAVLLFAGTGTALAGGPHHRGPNHGHGRNDFRPPQGRHWNSGFRGPVAPYCAPQPRVTAYPVPVYPAYPAYGSGFGSQFGFGVAARNFSLWFQQ